MKRKSNAGRPTKMTENLIVKLEEVFKGGGTIEEACLYVGINPDTYFERMREDRVYSDKDKKRKHDEFVQRMRSARIFPTLGCKRTIVKAGLKGDWRAADTYLSKTNPERKSRTETTVNNVGFSGITIEDATGEKTNG